MNFTKRFRHADRDAQPQLRDLRRLTRTQNVRPERRQRLRAEKQPTLLARHAQAGHIGIAKPFPVTQPLERQQMPARQFPSGRLLQRTHAHRARQRQQLGDRDALRGHLPSQKIRSQPTEKRLVLAQERCRVGRVLHEGGIHALERRHGMVPDAVAGIGIGRVRAVLHVRDGMGGQVGLRLRARRVQHRAQELAALRPAYVYVPVEILDSDFPRLAPFLEQGAQVVAVLPRVITDDQAEDMHAMLARAAENGVQEALVGKMGQIFFARRAGMRVRGDFGLNVFNSFTEEVLQQAGLVSATASFELRVAQIRDLAKSIDTEMIVYGRLPCMITEQCIIRNSAGRCNCSVPNNLADRRGALFPVLPAFGHRNQIFNAHKLYLADKHEDYETAGLWGVRLMFTTETPRECVAVTQSYLGLTDYRPNGLTRGLYYRGVE